MLIISESRYEEVMKTRVEPFLRKFREEFFFEGENGARLYCEIFRNPDAKAAIVISHGFCESCVKYSELIYYFLNCGYSVFIPEHRGHGLSYRENDDIKVVHVNSFSSYVKDLEIFIDKFVKPEGLPIFLYAHSMGGAIGALYMENNPGVIKRAVLSSPMIAPKRGFLTLGSAKAAAGFMKYRGKGKSALFISDNFKKVSPPAPRSASSRARADYYIKKRQGSDYLKTSSPSYGWSYEALGVTEKILDPKKLERIDAEVLLLSAGNDRWVLSRPQEEFINGIKHGKLISFPNARHELYRECNETLKKYMSLIMSFYNR